MTQESTARSAERSSSDHGIHRTKPWIAVDRSGSLSAALPTMSPKRYEPSSSLFGHGASTCPRRKKRSHLRELPDDGLGINPERTERRTNLGYHGVEVVVDQHDLLA